MGKTGTTAALQSMSDVCGKTVAVQTGSAHEAALTAESTQCGASGKPKINLLPNKDLPAIALSVSGGRADYASTQVPVLAYNASHMEGLEVAKLTYLEGLVGFIVPKGSDLTAPLGQALDELIANGTYGKIMEKWGLANLAVQATSVNAGTVD
jgi:polar amino acid transport system substrate-binding protein